MMALKWVFASVLLISVLLVTCTSSAAPVATSTSTPAKSTSTPMPTTAPSVQATYTPTLSIPCPEQDPTVKVSPSLVEITTFDAVGEVFSQGSGFIVDEQEGLILTATHVISGADAIYVTFRDLTSEAASWVARNPSADISLLQVRPIGFPALLPSEELYEMARLGASSETVPVQLEELVGLGVVDSTYITRGGITESVIEDNAGFVNIEVSVAGEPGMSGGPLVDRCGQLVGLISLGSEGQPASMVGIAVNKSLVDSLIVSALFARPTPTPVLPPTATPTPLPTPTSTPRPKPTPTPRRTVFQVSAESQDRSYVAGFGDFYNFTGEITRLSGGDRTATIRITLYDVDGDLIASRETLVEDLEVGGVSKPFRVIFPGSYVLTGEKGTYKMWVNGILCNQNRCSE